MSMPTVTIVGRPNVGKSTLFNRIVGERKALVSPIPGVTRDRNIDKADWNGRNFWLVDTGGFEPNSPEPLTKLMRMQAEIAIDEADLILLLLDNKTGLMPDDYGLAETLRKSGRPLLVVVNKMDSLKDEQGMGEFWKLGLEPLLPISAEHGLGVGDLLDAVVQHLPPKPEKDEDEDESKIRIAIVGRPNVGKSSLVNRLLNQERVIVSDIAGTTRDSIDSPLTVDGKEFLLIDTAGIRRKNQVEEHLEKLSVLKALKAVERAHVVLLMVDADYGLVEQDIKIAGLIHEAERCCMWVVNKWDTLEKDNHTYNNFIDKIRERAKFHDYAPIEFISALTGQRVQKLLPKAAEIYERASTKIGTSELNKALEFAFRKHQAPSNQGKPAKLFYATQVRVRPPVYSLFMDHPEAVNTSYERYLLNRLREMIPLEGVPIRLQFKNRRKRDNV